jgi:hypothetical protein
VLSRSAAAAISARKSAALRPALRMTGTITSSSRSSSRLGSAPAIRHVRIPASCFGASRIMSDLGVDIMARPVSVREASVREGPLVKFTNRQLRSEPAKPSMDADWRHPMNVHQYHPKGLRGTLWFQSADGEQVYDGVTAWIMGLSMLDLILAIAFIV